MTPTLANVTWATFILHHQIDTLMPYSAGFSGLLLYPRLSFEKKLKKRQHTKAPKIQIFNKELLQRLFFEYPGSINLLLLVQKWHTQTQKKHYLFFRKFPFKYNKCQVYAKGPTFGFWPLNMDNIQLFRNGATLRSKYLWDWTI